jgi:hypothetical protein
MGRVEMPPNWEISQEKPGKDWVYSWKNVRRCYIRIDGVMKGQGWLIKFQSSWYQTEPGYEEKQVFLAD